MATLWVGTYPDGGAAGRGEGIWQVRVDDVTGEPSGARLVALSPSPSFLAVHPGGHTLYAVAEVDAGEVTAFAITPGAGGSATLTPRGPAVSTVGAHPCHVAATADTLLISNYGSGTFTTVALDTDGALAGPAVAHEHAGSGPDPQRQDGPHAHSAGVVGEHVWVADLGTDEIRRYHPARQGVEEAGIAAVLPAGSGPRHFAAVPGGVAVATELDSGLYVLTPGARGADLVARYDATAAPAPDGGRNHPSHVASSADGSRLFVAVRGADVLSTFAVTPASGGGAPMFADLADTPTGGSWPRHFAVLPAGGEGADAGSGADLVVVANQNSSDLTVLRIARQTGRGELVGRLALPAPACVLVARH